jgi:HPt (histidine-containing phosphotransfer) domain-containing protein
MRERDFAAAVDRDVLARIASEVGPAEVDAILASFADEIREQSSELAGALEHRLFQHLAQCAHRLKGDAGAIGAWRLEAWAAELETAARRHDLEITRAALEDRERLVQEVLRGLDSFRSP